MQISYSHSVLPIFSIVISNAFSIPRSFDKSDQQPGALRRELLRSMNKKQSRDVFFPTADFWKDSQRNFKLDNGINSEFLTRLARSDRNLSRTESGTLFGMDDEALKDGVFGSKANRDGDITPGSDDDLLGSTSDYVLIAMIVAMMFCMTLCCLCLFCRSSSRLSICGINFELNDRRNSVEDPENQSEIHEVVPLTPTTAGDYNNRISDIENMLRSDAPPPMYNEIVKKAEAASNQQAKAVEAKGQAGKSTKKKSQCDRSSESSSVRSNGGRSSWRISGRGILASFRAKSSMLRSRRSDSAIQCPTVQEGTVLPSCHSDHALPPTIEEVDLTPRARADEPEEVAMETVDEVTKQNNESKTQKVFVYDVNELAPDEDDDVFL